MVNFRGEKVGIMYVAETSFGNGGTATTAIGKVTNFSPSLKNNFIRLRGLGEGRNAVDTIYGAFDCGGTIDWEVHDFAFLQFLVGPQSGAGTTADPYVLTEADSVGYTASDIKTAAVEASGEEGATDDVDLYKGFLINNVTFTAEIGEPLKATADWIAQKPVSSTSGQTYSASTVEPFVFYQGSLLWGATPSAVADVSRATVTISNGLYIYRSLGDRFIKKPQAGPRNYDFEITCKMTDTVATTLRDDFYGQANEPSTGVASARPTADLELKLLFSEGAASGNRNAYIWLDQCCLDEMSKPVTVGEGLVEVTFRGWAETGRSNTPLSWWTET